MSMINYNERVWGIDIISFINQQCSDFDFIRRASGEYSMRRIGETTLFPDVLLFGGSAADSLIQGWELKMPDTRIDDPEFIKNAEIKARSLKLNSFLLWNGVDVKLYINQDNKYEICPNFTVASSGLRTREEVHLWPNIWKDQARDILSKLNSYLKSGVIKPITVRDLLIDGDFVQLLLNSQQEVVNHVKQKIKNSIETDSKIKLWWKEVKNEYPGYKEPFQPLAYRIIIQWFNRLVFSSILIAYGKIKKPKTLFSITSTIEDGIKAFEEISSKEDYYNILGRRDFDSLIPDTTWSLLKEFFAFLQEIEFSKVGNQIVSQILHATVLVSVKKAAGLYVTPNNLAEFLVRLSLWDKGGQAIDPFCGTGTILKKIFDVRGEYDIVGLDSLRATWGCDKFGFPVQVASLAISSIDVIEEPLHIFTHDAFSLYVDEEIKFVNPIDGKPTSARVPIFDSLISNLPFVKAEDIKELNPIVLQKIETFYTDNDIPSDEQLDGRSDLYFYIPFLLKHLVKPGGIMGIIVSNAWMGTESGIKFFKLLQRFYHIQKIIVSGLGRWFPDTKVVTSIIILERRSDPVNVPEELTSFHTVMVNFSGDVDLVNLVSLLYSDQASSTCNTNVYTKSELLNVIESGLGINSCFGEPDWLLENISKFQKVSSSTSVNIFRGERRGWDELFYPSSAEAAKIEQDYLLPALLSTKNQKEILTKFDGYAFCCNRSEEELEKLKHYGALNWIRSFKGKSNKKEKPLTEVLKRSNLFWYEFGSTQRSDFVISMNPDERLIWYKMVSPAIINQRLIGLYFYDREVDFDLIHAVLNSIFVSSQIESFGMGRGEGVLDINSSKLAKGLYLPRFDGVDCCLQNSIKKTFKELTHGDIPTTIDSLDDKKWVDFNLLVGEWIGLSPDVVVKCMDHFRKLYTIRKAVLH